MIRVLAVAIAAAVVVAPNFAGAQSKSNDSPVSASRFGISIDGVQKPKAKGLKSTSGKKGSGAKSYKPQNAWPKKGY
jgi:hypothetical protein